MPTVTRLVMIGPKDEEPIEVLMRLAGSAPGFPFGRRAALCASLPVS